MLHAALLALLAAAPQSPAGGADAPLPVSATLAAVRSAPEGREALGSGVVLIRAGERAFATFHADGAEKPFVHPLLGPTGARMTRDWPMAETAGEARDHPHHRSLWFAHGDVNGHDFWHGAETRIVRDAPVALEQRDGAAVVRTRHRWETAEGTLVCTEERAMTFRATAEQRVIELELSLVPAGAPLVLGDTKEGTFALRLHPALRLKGEVAAGHMRNSAGDEGGACWGKRAAWATAWGPVDGETVGVAVFDHPTNPAHPTRWHARDYGLFAANPFGLHDFEGAPERAGELVVPADGRVTFRYRVLLYAGEPDFAALERAWRAWAD